MNNTRTDVIMLYDFSASFNSLSSQATIITSWYKHKHSIPTDVYRLKRHYPSKQMKLASNDCRFRSKDKHTRRINGAVPLERLAQKPDAEFHIIILSERSRDPEM